MKTDGITKEVTDKASEDTLGKVALAAAAGIVVAAGAKKLYKKYKDRQLEKKYTGSSREEKFPENDDILPDAAFNISDAYRLRKSR